MNDLVQYEVIAAILKPHDTSHKLYSAPGCCGQRSLSEKQVQGNPSGTVIHPIATVKINLYGPSTVHLWALEVYET